jgi:hypothetical protein
MISGRLSVSRKTSLPGTVRANETKYLPCDPTGVRLIDAFGVPSAATGTMTYSTQLLDSGRGSSAEFGATLGATPLTQGGLFTLRAVLRCLLFGIVFLPPF